MPHNIIFRIVFAVLMMALYAVRLGYKWKLSRQKREGHRQEMSVRIATLLWAFTLIVYLSGIPWLVLPIPLPEWIRWVGVACFALCLALSAWTYRTLGVHFSPQLELLENHTLVTDGPYRFVRHPMYATLFLSALSACLISGSVAVFAASVLLTAVILRRMPKEDYMLEDRFGDNYRAYAHRTGAVLPKLPIF